MPKHVTTTQSSPTAAKIVSEDQERLENEIPTKKSMAETPGSQHSSNSSASQTNPAPKIWDYKIPKLNAVENKSLDSKKAKNKVKAKNISDRPAEPPKKLVKNKVKEKNIIDCPANLKKTQVKVKKVTDRSANLKKTCVKNKGKKITARSANLQKTCNKRMKNKNIIDRRATNQKNIEKPSTSHTTEQIQVSIPVTVQNLSIELTKLDASKLPCAAKKKIVKKSLPPTQNENAETQTTAEFKFVRNSHNQIKFLFYLRSTLYENMKFSLLPEVENPKKLSDELFIFENTANIVVCEIKYINKENLGVDVSKSKLSYRQMSNPQFDLKKYFKIFLDYKHDHSPELPIKKIVIYCNFEWNRVVFLKNRVRISTDEENLTQFQVLDPCEDGEEHDWYRKFLDCCTLPNLAKEIDHCMDKKKCHFNTKIMKKYIGALVRERVIKIVSEKKNEKNVNIAKFHPDFIANPNNLSRPARQLRCFVFKIIGAAKMLEKNFSIANLADVSAEPSKNLPEEEPEFLFKEFFQIFRYGHIENNFNEYDKSLSKQLAEAESVGYTDDIEEVALKSLQLGKSLDDTLQLIEKKISKCKVVKKPLIEVTEMNVVFGDETLTELKNQLGNGDRRIIHLRLTKSISLTDLVIKQVSKCKFVYTDQEALFISGDVLLEMTDNVIDALTLDSTKLLVIQWNEETFDEMAQLAFAKIQSVLDNLVDEVKKSVIVVAKCDSNISQLSSVKINDNESSFKLTRESENEILENKSVIIQHHQISLLDLMDNEAATNFVKMPQVVESLIYGKLSIENELLEPSWLSKNYFDPQLKQRVIIDQKIFEENIDDVSCIKNPENKKMKELIPSNQELYDSKQFPLNAKFVMLDPHIDNYSLIFEHFQNRPVHILNYVDSKFVWQTTHGSIASLLKHKVNDIDALKNSNSIDDVLNTDSKTIIISGDSGMGKSTYLYNLAQRAYEASRLDVHDLLWVIYVNFEQLDIQASPETIEEALELLATYLQLDTIQKKLFFMSENGVLKLKIALFVDGCDDLPSQDLKAPIKVLKKLQETYINKIVVTSRSGSTLEAELSVFSHQLQFCREQKIQLVEKYWSVSSDEARAFIENHENLDNAKNDSISTPLHLKMLAEINKDKNELVPIHNYHDLYKNYIQLKVETDNIDTVEKLLMQKMLRNKVTIEVSNNNGIPKDVYHISFAEYAIACRLSNCCVPTNNPHYKYFIPLINNTFINSMSGVFLGTLLPLLQRDNNIELFMNKLAQDGHLQFLKTILKFEKNVKPCLHDLVKSSDRERSRNFRTTTLGTLTFILKHYNNNDDNQIMKNGDIKPEYLNSNIVNYVNLKKENVTPLQVADSQNKVDLACELLLYGANVLDLQNGHADFILRMASYTVMKVVAGDSRFYSVVEKLLMTVLPEDAIQLCRRNWFKILDHFFRYGRLKIIERLLRDPDDRSNFLSSCPEGKRPVNLVNNSHELNDVERCKMIQYIGNNFGIDHINNDIHEILRSACRYNHWHTFTCCLGNELTEFLKSILQNNEHDVLDFLKGRGKIYLADNQGNSCLHFAVTLGVSQCTIGKTAEICGIDDTNNDGRTALHVAFLEGASLARIKYLVDRKNASLIQKDKHGLYPWCYLLIDEFCRYDKPQTDEIIDYLLVKGVQAPDYMEPNIVNDAYIREVRRKFKYYLNLKNMDSDNIDEDVTALHVALKDRVKESWCKFLIGQTSDINASDSEGRTLLHVALGNRRYQLAKLILQRGAIIDLADNNGMTPLQILVSTPETSADHMEMKNLLELAENIFSNRRALRDELWKAREEFENSAIRYLVGCLNRKRQNLYHIAAGFGCTGIIMKVTRFNAHCREKCKFFQPLDINQRDEDGNTALHIAAEKGYERVVRNLLRYGASCKITNNNGQTATDLAENKSIFETVDALFTAVKNRELERAKEVLKGNENYLVNARDEFGKCSLHYATDPAIMKLLLQNFHATYVSQIFVDLELIDFNSRSPSYYAAKGDNLDCVKLLLRAGDSCGLKNFDGEKNQTVALLRDIETLFEDINSDDPKYFTNENVWQLEEFLKNKCREVIVNARDNDGNTLLHYAAKYNFTKAIEILLKNGAVYNAKNKKNEVPQGLNDDAKKIFESVDKLFKNVDLAVWREIKLDPQIVVNCRTKGGGTLLHEAVKAGKVEEKEWLLEKGANVEDTDDFGVDTQSLQTDA